jgi:tetratricopeptide (TPR) repeat protein
LGLAKCYRALGRKRESQELLDKLCAANPESWEVWAERGRLALQQGKRELAEKCFRKAVAANPYENTSLYNLYLCLRQKGKAKRAEANQVHARYMRLTKDSTRLNILITQEVSKEPNNPAVTFEIARVLKRLGQEQAAENWLQKTIELRPDHRGARKALGAYYEKIGKKELAARFK